VPFEDEDGNSRLACRPGEGVFMLHTIEFAADIWVDLEWSPKQPLERVRLRRGTRTRAQVHPHVLETAAGPVETADLFFENRTVGRNVPFGHFSFVEG
jgi:hypothetical protein